LPGEYDGTGALMEETIWLGDVPVATLQPDANGNVVIYYIHTDHLNTPRKVSRPATISSCGDGISTRLPISSLTAIRRALASHV
jgi:hypothetical protein